MAKMDSWIHAAQPAVRDRKLHKFYGQMFGHKGSGMSVEFAELK